MDISEGGRVGGNDETDEMMKQCNSVIHNIRVITIQDNLQSKLENNINIMSTSLPLLR